MAIGLSKLIESARAACALAAHCPKNYRNGVVATLERARKDPEEEVVRIAEGYLERLRR